MCKRKRAETMKVKVRKKNITLESVFQDINDVKRGASFYQKI